MYTLKETLEKLNITKYKFDKLKKHGYINPSKIDKWNGMYYIEELVIDSKEVDKLTPKRLEKIFEKITGFKTQVPESACFFRGGFAEELILVLVFFFFFFFFFSSF